MSLNIGIFVCVRSYFFFSSRRRHTRCSRDWSSDVCSSDLRMLEVQEREGTVIFSVRVQPRASKDEIAGEMGGALKVGLGAPAVGERGKEGLGEFWRRFWKKPRSAVRILRGERSGTKAIEINGFTQHK